MEPRKASEVLLALESKIDALLNIVKSQDLNIKILSNKLSNLMENMSEKTSIPKIVVETVTPFSQTIDNSKKIAVSADFQLPSEDSPKGFRRTSRPETYDGEKDYFNQKQVHPKFPVQLPPKAEVQVPSATVPAPKQVPELTKQPIAGQTVQNTVPVMQRVVDKNGKSVFLANVEITDLQTNLPIYKTKTNGTGKWMASLPVGNYKVLLNKRESLSKDKMEVAQNIEVDGSTPTLDLRPLIIK